MKAILVIDMPEFCGKCPCYHEGYGHCSINFRFVDDETQIPSWCPLKPMTQKKQIDIYHKLKRWDDDCDMAYSCGYNTCLEDILGETE